MTFGISTRIWRTAAIWVLQVAVGTTLVSCGSREVTDRKQQEEQFNELFGFAPPAGVADIRYWENSGPGGYLRLMRFSCDGELLSRILKDGSYKVETLPIPTDVKKVDGPAWWPGSVVSGTTAHVRDQDATPANEGFQFREMIWRDPASGHAYLGKEYWD